MKLKKPGGVPEHHFSILHASVLEHLLLSEKPLLQFRVLDVVHIKTKLEKVLIFRTSHTYDQTSKKLCSITFLSDLSPIISYACHSLNHSLLFRILD